MTGSKRALASASWRKSSHSGSHQNCVEVGIVGASWRKSSSSGGHQNCVEVGPAPSVVGVRDSKNRAAGALAVTPTAWRAFIRTVTS